MESNKHNTLLKLKKIQIRHNFQNPDGTWTNHPVPFFIYPLEKYFNLHLFNYENLAYTRVGLKNIDTINEDFMFEYLKYDEDLKIYRDRFKTFGSEVQKLKLYRLKTFYKILINFLLSITTDLYYSKCHLFDYNVQIPVNDNQFNVLFGYDSRAIDFSFDKAFGYALELEKVIRQHFKDMLDIEFPEIDVEDVVLNNKKKKK